LFEIEKASQNGFAPYILDDKGYPLISWIITPYKKKGEPFVLELLYNRKHKNGCSILKMFLAIKKNLSRITNKFDLQLSFLPIVLTCNESSPLKIFKVLGFSA
jgi:hypothetical protein